MRKTLLSAFLLFNSLFLFSQTKSVYIDPLQERQTIEGWGVSLCWWANMCGKWNDKKIDDIVDMLVSEDALNMNIFRYNIGGGDDPSHIDGHMTTGKGKRAEMDGFKDSEESDYNWNADAGQRKIMLKIKEKRPDAVFEAFSNSAPYWMTYSGCSAGNADPKKDNLKPEYYEQFADYLLEVCKHYKEEYGIEFKTLEPFNESLSSYWDAMGSQEGCHFDASSQIAFLKVLYPKLLDSGLNTIISASDETSISASLTALKAYIKDETVMNYIGQWNTHTYSGKNSERVNLKELTKKHSLPLWMSESGSGGDGLSGNLNMAQRMINDIKFMMPLAWIDWQYIEEWNDQWCMIRANFSTQSYSVVKNYYVRMMVTKFIKQGYTIIDNNDDCVLSAISPEKDRLVMVVVNNTNKSQLYRFDLSGFENLSDRAEHYMTDATRDCAKIGNLRILDNDSLNFTSPATSVSTLVVKFDGTKSIYEPLSDEKKYLLLPRSSGNSVALVDGYVRLKSTDISDSLNVWNISTDMNGKYSFYTSDKGVRNYLTDDNVYSLKYGSLIDGSYSQKFSVEEFEPGFFKIISCRTDKSFDLEGESVDTGTKVGLWAYGNEGSNGHRQWKFIRIPFFREPEVTVNGIYDIVGDDIFFCYEGGSLRFNNDDNSNLCINIFNPEGKLVKSYSGKDQDVMIDISKGFYLMDVINNKGRISRKIYLN